ncbi:MAG: hypothetical protein B7Z08_00580 [Sphingomonadales bacterium 32-68-7]|nr:MAG: hypothetical protein B7Z33_00620 [Sphingomonadales bacterium 12-68-11]OYX10518.1 MAG: hypothetical protein B7Z08_00580 [Sphingomonadales bacterium 32-68-7]
MLKVAPPPHGWNAVAWELVIVTVGVLMALAAQQAVEEWNWRAVAAQERALLRTEVRDNLDAIQDRLVVEPCLVRKLGEIRLVLERAANDEPLGITGLVGLPLPSVGAKGAWNIALAGQGLSHMPHKEQLGFSNAFANFENWDRVRDEERAAWLDLAVLDRPETLTDADWPGIRRAYARAVAAQVRIASVGRFIFRTGTMGERPQTLESAQARFDQAPYGKEICAPLLAVGR